MLRLGKTWPLVLLLAGVGYFATPPPAQAAFELTLSNGINPKKVVTDLDMDGSVEFFGTYGNFNIRFVGGISKPLIGNPYLAEMDITSLSVTTSTGGTLRIYLTDTDFSIVPGANGTALLRSSIGGNISAGGGVTFQSWVNYGPGGNHMYGGTGPPLDPVPGGLIATTGVQPPTGSLTGNAFADDSMISFDLTTPGSFSMTSLTKVVLPAGGLFSSTDGVTQVITPEPATLALVLAGLPLLGFSRYWWRRPKVGPAAC